MPKTQNMIKYIIKRIILMIPILFLVLTITFLLTQFMAANPLLNKMGELVDMEYIQEELERIGWFDPWYIKLVKYYGNFFTGNWGVSYIVADGIPVIEIIGQIFPKTIELVIIPIIVIPIIGVKLGVISAKNRNHSKDTVVRGFAMVGVGIPVFWLATMLQYLIGNIFASYTYGIINLEILNSNSVGVRYPNPDWPFSTGFRIIDAIIYNDQGLLFDTLLHLILPVICLTFVSLVGITRQTRASMLEVMEKDYVRTARAKGVSEKSVINSHALRNALIPTSHFIVTNTAYLLTGAFVLEVAFNYTGMGYFLVSSILQGDFLLINGILIFIAIIILAGTLVADILMTIIDPRISYK